MSDANTHINYSLEDIQRYISGGMNAKEMHALERAALQDPFLADAIEGYRDASFEQSRQHLNEITAVLQKEKEETKVVAMPAKAFQWWQVAAMIIVVAGVGVFSWYIFGLNKTQDIKQEVAAVKVYKDTAEKNNPAATPLIEDSSTFVAQNKTQQKETAQNNNTIQLRKAEEKTALKSKKEGPEVSMQSNADVDKLYAGNTRADSLSAIASGVQVNPNLNKPAAKFAPAPLKDNAALYSNNISLKQFSGKITDNYNRPVASAVVNAGNLAIVSDKNGYFNLNAPDSSLIVSVSSVGYETVNKQLAPGPANNIVLSPDNLSLSEVVVTGYGTKKKEMAKNKEADTTFPAGGWQSFQEYVYKKLNKKFDSSNNDVVTNGNVVLEFSVDENGTPYDFKIIKSSGSENDAKAIDILKEGPRWISTKRNKKGKVEIIF